MPIFSFTDHILKALFGKKVTIEDKHVNKFIYQNIALRKKNIRALYQGCFFINPLMFTPL